MRRVLTKIFVARFYKANAGFFLFFFFVFFGAVEESTLLRYHFSLMKGMLGSTTVLLLVFLCWTAYHLKCTAHFLKIINSAEGSFLYNMQAQSSGRQWLLVALLYTEVYAPVFLYAILVFVVGIKINCVLNATLVMLFTFLSIGAFVTLIHYRMTNWLKNFRLPSFSFPCRKTFAFYILFHFTAERKNALLAVKAFSLSLLYLVLVWNKSRYSNDSFLLFYLLILLAHAVFPYLAVGFAEKNLRFSRNLPLSTANRIVAFILPYAVLFLPEAVYLFCFGDALSFSIKLGYIFNLPASLSLLTAIQYSEAQQKEEFVKAVFIVLFISLFIAHVQAFWLWIPVQLVIAAILFINGFYSFETREEP